MLTVIENFTQKEYGNTVAKLLTPNDAQWKFSSVQQHYKDLCSKKLSLLNVNGDFITIDKHPRIYNDFPPFFKGDRFELLCKAISDTRVSKFLEELIGKDNKFTQSDIKDIIDNVSEQWDSSQRAECFSWWMICFKSPYYIPKILKDQGGNWITSKDKSIFFPPSEDLTSMPKWHNVLILNREDSIEIEKIYRETCRKEDKREVINYLNNLGVLIFKEYSADSLITPLKNAIQGDYDRAVEFIRWIRQNNKIDGFTNSDKIFPCTDKTVHCAMEIYLGKEYEENPFIPFLEAVGKIELCEPSILYFDGESKENNSLTDFLKKFKFVKEPKIIESKISRYSTRECEKKYLEYGKNQLRKANNAEGDPDERIFNEESVETIENIFDSLEKIPTNTILKWIFGKLDDAKIFCPSYLWMCLFSLEINRTAKVFYNLNSAISRHAV